MGKGYWTSQGQLVPKAAVSVYACPHGGAVCTANRLQLLSSQGWHGTTMSAPAPDTAFLGGENPSI